jgi:hypothetical protein
MEVQLKSGFSRAPLRWKNGASIDKHLSNANCSDLRHDLAFYEAHGWRFQAKPAE